VVAAIDDTLGVADLFNIDGNRYTQTDLAHPNNKTWQSMLVPPGQ